MRSFPKASRGLYLFIASLPAASFLASCGGSSGGKTQTVSYSISGTVVNLAGTGGGLQLQANGGDTLSVNANGSFTFANKLASGSSYDVTISAQPTLPMQTCGVISSSGVVTADVTNVEVDCGHNEWTWMSGSNLGNQAGTYGTEGTAASANVPGARAQAVSWTDTSGNLWLFGGEGLASTATNSGSLNDLWKYSGGEWTWMSGSNVIDQPGSYGTKGTAASANVPGARRGAVAWTDTSSNLWIFGGNGWDSVDNLDRLNDLWKYEP